MHVYACIGRVLGRRKNNWNVHRVTRMTGQHTSSTRETMALLQLNIKIKCILKLCIIKTSNANKPSLKKNYRYIEIQCNDILLVEENELSQSYFPKLFNKNNYVITR